VANALTDPDGRFTFTGVPAGPLGSFVLTGYDAAGLIAVSSSGVVAAPGDVVTADLQMPQVAAVGGRVTFADGVTPRAGLTVQLARTDIASPVVFAQTDAEGFYSFPSITANAPFVVRVYHPFTGVYLQSEIFQVPASETGRVDVKVPGVSYVSVTALRNDGTPFVYVPLELQDLTHPVFQTYSYTNGAGTAFLFGVYEGTFTLRIRDYSGFVAAVSTAVAPASDGETVAVSLTGFPYGFIQGRVTAADGVTPAYPTLVTVVDPATGQTSGDQYTGPAGDFSIYAPVGTSGRLTASFPPTGAQASSDFSLAGASVTVNLSLPLSVVRGVVTYAGGVEPVSDLYVFASQGGNDYGASVTGTDGAYSVVGLSTGAFTVTAVDRTANLTGTASGTLFDLAVPLTLNFSLPPSGKIMGRVSHASGAPFANAWVDLYGTGGEDGYMGGTEADDQGSYSFDHVPLGTPVRVRAYPNESRPLMRESSTVVLSTAGEVRTLDVTLPAMATVRVSVQTRKGAAMTGAQVYIRDASSGYRFTGLVPEDGSPVEIPSVPEGPFTVKAYVPSPYQPGGVSTGAVTAATDGGVIDVVLRAPTFGTVSGTVFAADGVNGVPNTYVYALDPDNDNTYMGYAQTGSGGFFTFNNTLQPLAGRVFLQANAPSGGNRPASSTVTFASYGQAVLTTINTPWVSLTGTVTYADGATPVAYPYVQASQADPDGTLVTYYPVSTDAGGHFTVIGISTGPFQVRAQDNQSGLVSVITATAPANGSAVNVAVRMPVTGSVTGFVLSAGGAVVQNPSVVLEIPEISFTRYVSVNQTDSSYAMDLVAAGTATLRGCILDEFSGRTSLCGVSTGTVTAGPVASRIDVVLPATGTVIGRVLNSDGVTPLTSAFTQVESLDSVDFSGNPVSVLTVTDKSSGTYTAAGAAVGTVRVTAFPPLEGSLGGTALGTLSFPGGVVRVDLVMGNAALLEDSPYLLTGDDGFTYGVDCQGSLRNGGHGTGSGGGGGEGGGEGDRAQLNREGDGEGGGEGGSASPSAYYNADSLSLDSKSFPCLSVGTLESGGRQVVVGPARLSGLTVTRKTFSPESGRFVRYLDVLSNPTDAPVTTTLRLSTNFRTNDSTPNLVVNSNATGNTYFVVDEVGRYGDLSAASVFAGAGAPVPPSDPLALYGASEPTLNWTVTVPAHGKVSFLHFDLVRDAASDAVAQAQSLANLSDTEALTGLSADEKNSIKNFVVP
jgi:hypothetical protein